MSVVSARWAATRLDLCFEGDFCEYKKIKLMIGREKHMTEKEKMLAGKIYDPSNEELAEMRVKAHKLSQCYNFLYEDDNERKTIIDELIPHKGEGLFLQGPIYFDYGVFTSFGKNCYANFK